MKKVIPIVMALIIVFMAFALPFAQSVKAVAGVLVAGAVVAVMAMAGIGIVTAGMTSAQLQTWVEGKLEQWAQSLSTPIEHLIDSAGISVTISGMLAIGTSAAQGISSFISWLQSDLGLVDNQSTPIISSDDLLNGLKVVKLNATFGVFTVTYPTTAYCYFTLENGTYYCNVFMTEQRPYLSAYYNNALVFQGSVFSYKNGYYYTYISAGSSLSDLNLSNDIIHSNRVQYYLDDPSLTQSGSLTVTAGTMTIPRIGADDKIFLDVGALPGETVTQVTQQVIEDVIADELIVSGTVAESEPEYVIEGPVSVSGLDDIFPFCIPFDMYHMLEALAADPVAPSFDWRFYVPNVIDETITIDLSGFNTVASVLRIMETLLFCVGLAFETRKLLRS